MTINYPITNNLFNTEISDEILKIRLSTIIFSTLSRYLYMTPLNCFIMASVAQVSNEAHEPLFLLLLF